jgi:tetratricopeptide (TPR) repeat protein
LATKNVSSADSSGSSRLTIIVKNSRSPSIGNLSPIANPVVVPSATISRFSGVVTGGSGSQDGTSNVVLSLAAAVAGAALNKIEESEDGPEEEPEEEETEEVSGDQDDGRVRTPPILHRLNARLTSGSYLSVSAKPVLTRSGSVSSNMSKDANLLAGGASASGGYSAAFYKEVEEQLADTLFKRAQAKLMIETSAVNIEAALSDAIKSSAYQAEDDDYQMVIATCYIRLNRFEDALRVLQHVLDRSPNNFKALYNYSFCQRASGQQKSAIEGLTKVDNIFQ